MGPRRAPGHLAHVAEGGLGLCGQGDDAHVGPLAGGLVRRVAPERQEAPGGVEGPLRDGLELPGLAGLQVEHRRLVVHGLVAVLTLLRRHADGPRQPAAVGREARRRSPGEDAGGVLVQLAHAQLGGLVDAVDVVRDPVAVGRERGRAEVLPAAVVVRSDDGALLGAGEGGEYGHGGECGRGGEHGRDGGYRTFVHGNSWKTHRVAV